MKQKFSTRWKSSKQPRKQKKYLANAPLHLRKKFVSINMSKELRKKYSKRNIPVRKGDVVKVMSGKFKKKQGKVLEVNLKTSKIIVDGLQVKKQDGSKANVKMEPSNLQIVELNLDDKKRIRKFEGIKKITKKFENKTPEEKNALKKTKNT